MVDEMDEHLVHSVVDHWVGVKVLKKDVQLVVDLDWLMDDNLVYSMVEHLGSCVADNLACS